MTSSGQEYNMFICKYCNTYFPPASLLDIQQHKLVCPQPTAITPPTIEGALKSKPNILSRTKQNKILKLCTNQDYHLSGKRSRRKQCFKESKSVNENVTMTIGSVGVLSASLHTQTNGNKNIIILLDNSHPS